MVASQDAKYVVKSMPLDSITPSPENNDIYGEIFRYLSDLKLEDEIIVHTTTGAYRYAIRAKRIIEPTQVEVLDPTREPVVTLISCYPYLIDTQRIVVIGELVEGEG